MSNNGDTTKVFSVDGKEVVGLGSFHKTLPHNKFGEVDRAAFDIFVAATASAGYEFGQVPEGGGAATQFTNPQAGLSHDQLTHHPASYDMRPAPHVLSISTAAEMTELYWMALMRDVPCDRLAQTPPQNGNPDPAEAVTELNEKFRDAIADTSDPGRLAPGVDLPGSAAQFAGFTPSTLFRLGLPGEDVGPLISQFFLRPIQFGAQLIDPQIHPYAKGINYLTDFEDWLKAQNTGFDGEMQAYPKSNEDSDARFEGKGKVRRYITTMRDLARFVNKDALHQAYFNAAIILLSGGAKWTPGNPYGNAGRFAPREAGFGVLGGPHILALVSEVATRALKVVWNQKWQVHLRLRPEAYGGLVHVQNEGIGPNKEKRSYGLPSHASSMASGMVRAQYQSLLLPMAFTAGSPTHPAYGAGHATVAGACVTVLKAFFQMVDSKGVPIPFTSLSERCDAQVAGGGCVPFDPGSTIKVYEPTFDPDDATLQIANGLRLLTGASLPPLTIEGELNKLAMNVAMGRSMGGVHWRSDNTRSLILGEALAAEILADITTDSNEKPSFEFRSFARKADGEPKKISIRQGRIFVDGVLHDTHSSAL